MERLAQAVIEARVLSRIFSQLGAEADPKLAWRATEVGSKIDSILDECFPMR
jgi:hypothetical protein